MRLIDLSHTNPVTDWDLIQDPVILKCSQGVDFVDNKFKEYQAEARKRNLYLGSYHFADGTSPEEEANHFVDTVGEIKDGEFLVLDWEIEHADPDKWCLLFLERVQKLTGLFPMLYTNEARVKAINWKYTSKFPLWIAKYGKNDGTMGTEPNTGQWDKYQLWQYTSRGHIDGIDGYVDLNYTPLTIEELTGKQINMFSKCPRCGYPDEPQKKYHRYAHLSKVMVKVGDTVKHKDWIGNVGNTGGNYSSHLHYDLLTYRPDLWTRYTNGMSKEWVLARYEKPEVDEHIPTQFDHLGYGWLDWNGKGYHPGLDINGKGGGNSDLGNPVYSNSDGKVVHVYDGTKTNAGWGKMVVVES